jgi:hypothetical protein
VYSTTLIAVFHKFEWSIGITPVKGRAFYGLRRILADLGEDHTYDMRVLREVNRLGEGGDAENASGKGYTKKRQEHKPLPLHELEILPPEDSNLH